MYNQGSRVQPILTDKNGYHHLPAYGSCLAGSKRTFTTNAIPKNISIAGGNIISELGAKVINSENGYPNNIRKPECKLAATSPTMPIQNQVDDVDGALEGGQVVETSGPPLAIINISKETRHPATRSTSESTTNDSFIAFEGSDSEEDTESDSDEISSKDIETNPNCLKLGANSTTESGAKLFQNTKGYQNNIAKPECEVIYTATTMSAMIMIQGNSVDEIDCAPMAPQFMGSGMPSIINACKASRNTMRRTISECPSEDSFIVFEGCDDSDDDIDYDSDEISTEEDDDEEEEDTETECSDTDEESFDKTDGINHSLINSVHNKRVHFAADEHLAVVHHMITWAFAYQKSRKGHWEQYARDRERFKRRIEICGNALEKILKPEHRERIFEERFKSLEESNTPNASDPEVVIVQQPSHRSKPKRNRNRKSGKRRRRNRHKRRR